MNHPYFAISSCSGPVNTVKPPYGFFNVLNVHRVWKPISWTLCEMDVCQVLVKTLGTKDEVYTITELGFAVLRPFGHARPKTVVC